jgi:hypothetical protein
VETLFSNWWCRTFVPKFSPINYCLYWLDILEPSASSDTDTTLSLALKQFDQQNDKTTCSKFPMAAYLESRTEKYSKNSRSYQALWMSGNKFWRLYLLIQMPRVIITAINFRASSCLRYIHIAHLFLLGLSKSFCGRFATPQKYALPGFRCSQGQKELRYIHKVQLQTSEKLAIPLLNVVKVVYIWW